jgi:DNA-binding LacI/PurR family transcriptional regulator
MADFLAQFHAPILHILAGAKMQEEVGKMQAEHLLQRGKRSFLYLTTEREDVQVLSQIRLQGVRQACRQEGVQEPVVCMLPADRGEARPLLQHVLTSRPEPLGICCYNDEVAMAALALLADEEIAIPQRVAVIGCDNIPLAQWSIPALTTILFLDHALESLIEAIVTLGCNEAVTWTPQKSLFLIQRAST